MHAQPAGRHRQPEMSWCMHSWWVNRLKANFSKACNKALKLPLRVASPHKCRGQCIGCKTTPASTHRVYLDVHATTPTSTHRVYLDVHATTPTRTCGRGWLVAIVTPGDTVLTLLRVLLEDTVLKGDEDGSIHRVHLSSECDTRQVTGTAYLEPLMW